MSQHLLGIDRVKAGYGQTPVLRDVSISVGHGQVVALLGPNGAGKTTLLRMVSGIVRPTVGRVLLEGLDITRMAPHRIVKAGITQSPEARRMFPYMTTEENLSIGAFTRTDRNQVEADIEHFFDLWPEIDRRRKSLAGSLSGGEQQIVALGRALLSRPKVLLLDEPSLGLAPVLVSRVYEGLRAMVAERSQSVLLVEQNAKQALVLASAVNVLVAGEIVFSGPTDAVAAADVAKMYFANTPRTRGKVL